MMEKQLMLMRTLQFVAVLVLLSLSFTGCAWPPQTAPGTINSQRRQAVVHDPFPSNELGPPIMGARPLGFDQPLSEVRQLQSSPYSRRNQQGAPANPNYGY